MTFPDLQSQDDIDAERGPSLVIPVIIGGAIGTLIGLALWVAPAFAGGMAPAIIEYPGPKSRPAITCDWIARTPGARWKWSEEWEECRDRGNRPNVTAPEQPETPDRPKPEPEKPVDEPPHDPCACGGGFVQRNVA